MLAGITAQDYEACRRTDGVGSGPLTVRKAAQKKNRIWRWFAVLLVIAAAVTAIVMLNSVVDWPRLRDWMQHLNRSVLLLLSATLPLIGFSISLVYLVVGAVFGGPWGIVVVAGITAVHLLGSHWIGHGFLRERLKHWLQKHKKRFPEPPEGEDVSVALMMALVPGPPYFVRNYLLAVSGIPLRTYFWVCWPIYVLRSCVVIFLGDLSADFNAKRMAILAAIFLTKVGICAYILYRLRRRLQRAKEAKRPSRTPLQKRLVQIGKMD